MTDNPYESPRAVEQAPEEPPVDPARSHRFGERAGCATILAVPLLPVVFYATCYVSAQVNLSLGSRLPHLVSDELNLRVLAVGYGAAILGVVAGWTTWSAPTFGLRPGGSRRGWPALIVATLGVAAGCALLSKGIDGRDQLSFWIAYLIVAVFVVPTVACLVVIGFLVRWTLAARDTTNSAP